jgi:hypothetical protein
VEFIKHFNHVVQTEHPGVITVAEESTAWPLVTRPPYLGGLGFNFKWNMGWMHDTLSYFSRDAIYRKYHQNDLTFAMLYHHNENFILPLSHDEVVHGKGSLLGKMSGDEWQRFANLRALLAYQWLFPGKQLLMMGCEFGQSPNGTPTPAWIGGCWIKGPIIAASSAWCATSTASIKKSRRCGRRITIPTDFSGSIAATRTAACFHLCVRMAAAAGGWWSF